MDSTQPCKTQNQSEVQWSSWIKIKGHWACRTLIAFLLTHHEKRTFHARTSSTDETVSPRGFWLIMDSLGESSDWRKMTLCTAPSRPVLPLNVAGYMASSRAKTFTDNAGEKGPAALDRTDQREIPAIHSVLNRYELWKA
ncbi:hypothetical protein COCON_G00102280 [Conger conger]|uniref:Uncharacterized protein n=1 Tax=Conger conger TaxID=82655 RepID=A0A9Q1DHZ4_CONCO|nr:hypothetical protein COCON_G00102280 [Conger conger]